MKSQKYYFIAGNNKMDEHSFNEFIKKFTEHLKLNFGLKNKWIDKQKIAHWICDENTKNELS